MKKLLPVWLMILAFTLSDAKAQCPNVNIIIQNQNDLNQFMQSYPQCHKVLKSFTLANNQNSPFTDLSGLIRFDTILGDFRLNISNKVDLSSLNNLKHIGGYLNISGMNQMTEITDFDSLKSIRKGLEINNNALLTSIRGFESLKNASDISISANENLKTIDGFPILDTLNGTLSVNNNNKLISIKGFQNLTVVERIILLFLPTSITVSELPSFDALKIIRNDFVINGSNLTLYKGLSSLDSLGFRLNLGMSEITQLEIAPRVKTMGTLELTSCPKLKKIVGFDSLKTVNGIRIVLSQLTQLNQFNSLQKCSGDILINCPELSTLRIFNQLKSTNNFEIITQKATSFNIAPLIQSISGSMELLGPSVEECNDFNQLTSVQDNLRLNLYNTPRLPDFPILTQAGGLIIDNFRLIRKIDGFKQLEKVKGIIDINLNNNLDSITAFNRLILCGGLYINSNAKLVYLSDFPRLDTLGRIALYNNPKLKKLNGFNNLKYLYNPIYPDPIYPALVLNNCFELNTISGFEKLEICGTIDIINSLSLKTISGFTSLRQLNGNMILKSRIEQIPNFNKLKIIKGSFDILSNDLVKLPEFQSLEIIEKDLTVLNTIKALNLGPWPNLMRIDGRITIGNLIEIKDIAGLRNLDATQVKELNLYGNTKLTTCNNLFVCTYLALGKKATIQNNAPGCNNVNEINCDGGLVYGKVFYDRNQNKKQDADELGMPNQIIEINGSDFSLHTNSSGNFALYCENGTSYSLKLNLNPKLKLTSDSVQFHFVFDPSYTNQEIFSYGLKHLANSHEGRISLTSDALRCNEQVEFHLHIANNGSYDEDSEVRFYYKDIKKATNFVPIPNIIDSIKGLCIWKFSNFIPPSSKSFNFKLAIPSEQFVGDTLPFFASYQIKDEQNKYILADSTQYQAIIRCAYDPNDKAVFPLDTLKRSTSQYYDELTYTIRFQNLGNDVAKKVRIVDELSSDLDLSSFNFIQSSHPCYMKLDQKTFSFEFNDINLVAKSTNEALSQGFVTFKIKLKTGLPNGRRIGNKALIYFDANSPTVTNTATNHIIDLVSATDELVLPPSDLLFPNPVNEVFCLNNNEINDFTKLEVIGLSGKIAYKGNGKCHNVSKLQSGLWMARIKIKGKEQLIKFIKI